MKLTRKTSLSLLLAVTAGLSSCSNEPNAPSAEPQAQAAASSQAQGLYYQPTTTFQEVMDSVVDASADFIWQSFRTVSDAKGMHEFKPRTEEEWHEVRRRAVTLAESANLLAVPGRKLAHGDKTLESGDKLDVATLQQRLDTNHEELVGYAHALRDISMQMVAAADKQDLDRMMELGGTLDEVCEACHMKFWYPEATY